MFHRILKPQVEDARLQDIWLTVYSDLITNLVLVFLALFGLVMMGEKALMRAIESLERLEHPKVESLEDPLEIEKISFVLKEEFSSIPDIQIIQESGATRISLGEQVLFKSGHAELKPEAGPILETIGNLLRLVPYTIIVEGHTDDRPLLSGSQYKNNWELSLARSMAVVRLLTANGAVPENQIAAAAYGAWRPLESNDTPEGRRLNRRVEIALFREFPYALQ